MVIWPLMLTEDNSIWAEKKNFFYCKLVLTNVSTSNERENYIENLCWNRLGEEENDEDRKFGSLISNPFSHNSHAR